MRSSQTVKNLLPRVQKEHILPFHKTLRRIIKYTQTRGVIPLQSINTYKEKQILCHNIYQAFHLLSSRITTIFICLRRYQSLPTVATQGDALLHTRANRIIFGFRWKNSDSVIKTSEWSRWLLRHIRTSRRLTWATRLYTVYSRFFSYFFFLPADPFCLRKISTDPQVFVHLNTRCPDDGFQLKICISELTLDSYWHVPPKRP